MKGSLAPEWKKFETGDEFHILVLILTSIQLV